MTKEIKGECALWNKFIPEIQRKVGVSGTEAGNEMGFEGLNFAFSKVETTEAGRGKFVLGNVFIVLKERFYVI